MPSRTTKPPARSKRPTAAPKVKAKAPDYPTRAFATVEAWEAWLARHHASAPGLWVKFAKKGSGQRSMEFPPALEAALCFGWIDGLRRGVDAQSYVQKFTPRARRSLWSKVNREKVLALIAAGRMQPAGLAEVQRAQADGRWDAAYDSPSRATVPDDLAAALRARPRAEAFFATVSATNRYAVLHRVHTAKRPETRARRIAQFVDMLERGEVIHPDR